MPPSTETLSSQPGRPLPRTPKAHPRSIAASRAPARPIDFQARDQRNANPLEVGLIQLPTRPTSIYTQGMRKAAIDECEIGKLRLAADLTLAAVTESAYCRGILADLVEGLWGLPRHWTGRADMIQALDTTPEHVGEFARMFPQPDAIRLMSWGITLGMGVGQMRRKYGARASYDFPVSPEEAANGVWRQPSKIARPIGAYNTRTLYTWSPKYARWQWWDDSWWLLTADGEIRIAPLDDSPNLDEYGHALNARTGNPDEWLQYMPYGRHRPWEWGAWKSATQAFIAERDAIFDRLRHAELLAPLRVGKVPAGTTETQRRKYLRQIREMQRLGILVLPPGLEYTVVEAMGRITGVYKDIIDASHAEFAMITGALTTAEGNKGFARGDVQERFTRSILASFAGSLAECFHAGGLVPWGREEFGTDDAPRPGWDTVPPEDKKARAETLKTASDALAGFADSLAAHNKELTPESVETYVQSLGLATRDIPVRTPHPKIEISSDDRKFAYTLDEIRAGDGWPVVGDDRGKLLVSEAEALGKQRAAAAPPVDGADAEDVPPGDAPTDEAAHTLAAKMTSYGVERCAHERPNRCPLCGVERLRDFTPQPDGTVRWHVAWRPIMRGAVAAPAMPLNGAAHVVPWAHGGEA